MGRWHGVASWTWDAHDDACGICRMAFDGCCPDCKNPGDGCPLSMLHFPVLFCSLFSWNMILWLAQVQLHLVLWNQVYVILFYNVVGSVGSMQPCISSALHLEVGEFAKPTPSVSHVPSGLEVSGGLMPDGHASTWDVMCCFISRNMWNRCSEYLKFSRCCGSLCQWRSLFMNFFFSS